jgi:hypothetical protein
MGGRRHQPARQPVFRSLHSGTNKFVHEKNFSIIIFYSWLLTDELNVEPDDEPDESSYIAGKISFHHEQACRSGREPRLFIVIMQLLQPGYHHDTIDRHSPARTRHSPARL